MLWDLHHKVYRQMENLCIMVVMILYVFFQCSRKAPKSQNSQGCKFPFLMLVSHVLPKKLPNSEHFPHWRHLCLEHCSLHCNPLGRCALYCPRRIGLCTNTLCHCAFHCPFCAPDLFHSGAAFCTILPVLYFSLPLYWGNA